jgi:hypothetical protein
MDFNKIVKEWAYRVDNGQPNSKNSTHLYHLSEILIENKWPFEVIDELLQNLTEQDSEREKLMKKVIKYKNKDGEDKEISVGGALKQGEEHPAYKQAKQMTDTGDKPKGDKVDEPSDFERGTDQNKGVDPDYTRDKKPKKEKSKVKTKSFKNDVDTDYVNSPTKPSDEEYEKSKPEQLELKTGAKPIKFSDDESEFLSGKYPKKYIKVLERILNTKKIDTFRPNIKSFTDSSGAGQISSTAGEILTMMSVSMTDEQFALLEQKMGEHFNNIGDSVKDGDLILDRDWVESARGVRQGVSERYNDYYGEGNWEMVGSAWDTRSDVEALGFDYDKKGFSTDAYFRLKVNGQDILDELSLKKDFDVALAQPGVGEVFYWVLATNEKDKKEYDEIQKKLMAVDDTGKPIVKTKEKKELNTRKTELLRKHQDIIGDDGNPTIRQQRENDSSLDYISNISQKQLDFLDKITEKDIKSFSKFNATNYIKDLIPRLKKLKPPVNRDDLREVLNPSKRGVKDINKSSMWMARILGKVGDEKSTKHVDERIGITNTFTKAFVQNLVKVPELKAGITSTIREKFPLNALMSGEETMALGGASADKKVLKEIFGTDNYDEVETNLEVDGPDDKGFYQLLYKVKGTGKVVNLANLRARQRGIGYSTTPNFEMKLHEDFKGELYKANVTSGRNVYDPKEGNRASLANKYGEK